MSATGTGSSLRAGVFIGVARSGGLTMLHDACDGARSMHAWALAQGFVDGKHAKLITDDEGRNVSVDRVFEAIEGLLSGAGVDQLVVYFAGHGVNINRNEHWLLSDAPRRPNAAVNVSGSVELARYCGVRHVVLISDACRSAPEGLQAQAVRGQDIFPNNNVTDRAQPVDQFFACALGRTALELADPTAAAATYKAVYTAALLDALSGMRPETLDPSLDPDDPALYVRPVLLEEYLEREVPARIRARGLQYRFNQQPEALLMAHPGWLSRITAMLPQPERSRPTVPDATTDLRRITRDLFRIALRSRGTGSLGRAVWKVEQRLEIDAGLTDQIRTTLQPFGPDHYESGCGIKVRGASISDCFTPRMECRALDESLVQIGPGTERAASVVVQFDNGNGTVIPVFAGYLTALTLSEGELVDVGFEASANAPSDAQEGDQTDAARAVRAVAAAAARYSRLSLSEDDVELLRTMLPGILPLDLALAIYAAYALHDRQDSSNILDALSWNLRDRSGVDMFDVALLSRSLVGRHVGLTAALVPFTPLLSRGWALLDAHRVTLPHHLIGLETTLLDSSWSLYGPDGVARLRAVLASGEVK